VTVLLNDGIGGFNSRTEFTSGQTNRLPKQVTAADFDGDGDIDIATSNGGYYSGYIYTLPNMSQPNVLSVSPDLHEIHVDPSTDITATFDMDMDGATIDASSFVVSTVTKGFVSGAVSYDGPSRTATFVPSETFDDGELVSVSLTPGIESADGVPLRGYVWSFTVEAGAGSAGFNADVLYTLQDQPRNIQTADLNGDGHIDLAAVNRNSHTMSILINNGDGTYAPQVTYSTGGYPLYLFPADFDDDGDIDIAVPSSNDDDIRIFRNNGSGAFPAWTDYATDTYPSSIDGGDLDGDGDIDLVTGSGSDVAVLLNTGSGAFPSFEEYGTGSPVIRAYLFDADNDGALDVGAVQVNLDRVVVLMNSGTGTFSTGSTMVTGDQPNYMCASDFDDDGDLDIAVGNRGDSDVSYFRGGGNGFFTAMGTFPVAGTPVEIVAADLDADGDMDLATANYSTDNISLLLNNGSGSFASGGSFGTGDGTYGLCAADLDGNGTMDLVSTNFGSDNASVLTNVNVTCASLPITATGIDIPFVARGDTIAVMNFSSEALDSVRVCLYPGQLPSALPAGTDWVPRLYSITPYPAAAAFDVDLTLFYEQSEFDASGLAEEWVLHAYRYNNGMAAWEMAEGTVNTETNAVVCDGVTAFSQWGFSDSEALVDDEIDPVPAATALCQNFPNPFNPSTRIEYSIHKDTYVKLSVYDVLGREVRVLVDAREKAGYKSVSWNGKDNAGGEAASGVYFYRLVAGEFVETRKMILLR
jgi:hypothetical protein